MDAQLGGADPLLVRTFRKSLDSLEMQASQLKQVGDNAGRVMLERNVQRAVEDLDAEIRSTL